jgi:membrane associated rhomboid family serine protease
MASTDQAQTMMCYRHPRNETAVACSNCGRPICTECMVFASVGIKCPECAGQPTGIKKATTKAKSAASVGTGALVTKTLIGVNVLVFLIQQAQGGIPVSEIYQRGALFGPSIAVNDEWYRMITSGFLHATITHIGFNMLMLWWFGSALEGLLGRARFLTVYMVSLVAGSAGALLLSPDVPTVGASGAVFGVLGAGIVLERRGVYVFGGSAFAVVLLNLVLGFFIGNVSIGGHLGGLAGGMLATLALGGFSRGHAAYTKIGPPAILGLAGILVASVFLSYLSVQGTISL